MLITKEISVCATGKLLEYLKKLGYKVESHQKLIIPVEQLPNGTRKRVIVSCDVCEKEKEISYKQYLTTIDKDGYYCCYECKGEKSKKTCIEKYGVENPSQLEEIKDKKKNTLYKNYNTFNCFDLGKETIKNKYGVDNVFQSVEIKEKIKETNLIKYGVENPQQNKEIRDKTNKTCLEKYGGFPAQNAEIKKKLNISNHKNTFDRLKDYGILSIDQKYIYTMKCDNNENHTYKICNDLFYTRKNSNSILCTVCNKIDIHSSGVELKILNFIRDNYDGIILDNYRKLINPYELDIYLPDLNLAFEFNGIYWHNELYKNKDYHYNKYSLCKNKNTRLFQIYEDDLVNKEDIIKSMIINKIGKTNNKIFARKCEIKFISNEMSNKFLDENHIQ